MTDRGKLHIRDAHEDSVRVLLRTVAEQEATIRRLSDEHQRIVRVLTAFKAAPISVSSVQPILDLCDELSKEPTR